MWPTWFQEFTRFTVTQYLIATLHSPNICNKIHILLIPFFFFLSKARQFLITQPIYWCVRKSVLQLLKAGRGVSYFCEPLKEGASCIFDCAKITEPR